MFKSTLKCLLAVSVIVLVLVVGSMASVEHAYVGVKKCKLCHNTTKMGKIYNKWSSTAHARAYETLVEKNEGKNKECLSCHTLGYGKKGGYDPQNPKPELQNVGCEACHGPGGDYWPIKVMKNREKAIANGLVIKPTEENCRRCHNKKSPTFKGFDFKKAYPEVEHYMPRAK